MKFKYTLENIGWAKVELQIGNSEVLIYPSYATEPLIDLVRSIESLLPNCVTPDELETVVQFEWDSEPALYCWRIENNSDEIIRVEITCYNDGIKSLPGEVIVNEECSLHEFLTELILTLETILKTHGIIGYRKQWYAQDFPISSYLQLKYYLIHNSGFPVVRVAPEEWIEKVETNLKNEIKLLEEIL